MKITRKNTIGREILRARFSSSSIEEELARIVSSVDMTGSPNCGIAVTVDFLIISNERKKTIVTKENILNHIH